MQQHERQHSHPQQDTPSHSIAIARLCIDQYLALPTQLRCQPHEWTVLAGVVLTRRTRQSGHVGDSLGADAHAHAHAHVEHEVIALATGSRCLGQALLCPFGTAVADCHAEVLVTRVLRRYLMYDLLRLARGTKDAQAMTKVEQKTDTKGDGDEFKSALSSTTPATASASKFFEWVDDDPASGKVRLKPDLSFHLYISQLPCGDACIEPDVTSADTSAQLVTLGETLGSSSDPDSGVQSSSKRVCLDASAMKTTGAKLVSSAHASEPSATHWTELSTRPGELRTKSGRSDLPPKLRTLSMSCSDKIARWRVKGVQGKYLSQFLAHPIFYESITISCEKIRVGILAALHRALHARIMSNYDKSREVQPSENMIMSTSGDGSCVCQIQLPAFIVTVEESGRLISPEVTIIMDASTPFPEWKGCAGSDVTRRLSSSGKCALWASEAIFSHPQREKVKEKVASANRDYVWKATPTGFEVLQGTTGLRFGLPPPSQKFKPSTLLSNLKDAITCRDVTGEPKNLMEKLQLIRLRVEHSGVCHDVKHDESKNYVGSTPDTVPLEGGVLYDVLNVFRQNPNLCGELEASVEGPVAIVRSAETASAHRRPNAMLPTVGALLVERQSYISSISRLAMAKCLLQLREAWNVRSASSSEGHGDGVPTGLRVPNGVTTYDELTCFRGWSTLPNQGGVDNTTLEVHDPAAFGGWLAKPSSAKMFLVGHIQEGQESSSAIDEDWAFGNLRLGLE